MFSRNAAAFPWGERHANAFDETDMQLIRDYFAKTAEKEAPSTTFAPPIDDITWSDLDMDALYKRLNGCFSAAGDNFLYAALRRPLADPEAIRARDAKIRAVSREGVRDALASILLPLGRDYRLHWDFLLGRAQTPSRLRLFAYIGQSLLFAVSALLFAAGLPAGLYCFLLCLSVNAVTTALSQKRMASHVPTILWAMQLVRAARRIDALDKSLLPPGLLGPLKRFKAGKVAYALYNEGILAMCFEFFFLSNLILYERFLFQLGRLSPALHALMMAVGEVDALRAMGSWRAEMEAEGWCAPEFVQQDGIEIAALRHPLVEHCVPNSLRLQRPILLTGSNASGKSTFLKAVGLCAILAQSVATCPAGAYRARPHAIFSSMSLRDDVLSGASYFMTEIRSVLRIVNYAGALPCLALIDEVLRGTNTGERISAACAVLRRLAGMRVHCIAATHDGELPALLGADYDNYHFAETFENGDMRFDYQLKPGPSESFNAIALIERLGGDEALVGEARALWQHYRQTGKWPGPAQPVHAGEIQP